MLQQVQKSSNFIGSVAQQERFIFSKIFYFLDMLIEKHWLRGREKKDEKLSPISSAINHWPGIVYTKNNLVSNLDYAIYTFAHRHIKMVWLRNEIKENVSMMVAMENSKLNRPLISFGHLFSANSWPDESMRVTWSQVGKIWSHYPRKNRDLTIGGTIDKRELLTQRKKSFWFRKCSLQGGEI